MLPVKTGLPGRALRLVPYLSPEEVRRLCGGCRGRHQERDALLNLVLFQTGLRISEALSLTVSHLNRHPGTLEIVGKGGNKRLVACPAPLSHRLKAFAFDKGLGPEDKLFPGAGKGPGRSSNRRPLMPAWPRWSIRICCATPTPSRGCARP
jgi:integrase